MQLGLSSFSARQTIIDARAQARVGYTIGQIQQHISSFPSTFHDNLIL